MMFYCIGNAYNLNCSTRYGLPQCLYCHNYSQGLEQAAYPVPAVHGSAFIYPECVVICDVDEWGGEPIITWWNESYGLPLPADHGIATYWREQW